MLKVRTVGILTTLYLSKAAIFFIFDQSPGRTVLLNGAGTHGRVRNFKIRHENLGTYFLFLIASPSGKLTYCETSAKKANFPFRHPAEILPTSIGLYDPSLHDTIVV